MRTVLIPSKGLLLSQQTIRLCVTSTSQIESQKKYIHNDRIFLKANEEASFELDTYIQLHRVFELDTEKLKQHYSEHDLKPIGRISLSLSLQITKRIINSNVIESKYRKRIKSESGGEIEG